MPSVGLKKKACAAAVFLGATALAVVPLLLFGSGARPTDPTSHPKELGALVGKTPDGTPWELGSRDETGAIVYVARSCPYCKAELQSWARLWRDLAPLDPWVVMSPDSPPDPGSWMPPELKGRVVHDHTGDIARMLGVRSVPATYWLSQGRRVRAVRIGRQSVGRIRKDAGAARGAPK